jgi:prolyl oligopeptidase
MKSQSADIASKISSRAKPLRAAVCALAVMLFAIPACTRCGVSPPVSRTDNVREVLHGTEIIDPYRWLEDQNSPETREWINAQNEHTRTILTSIPGREKVKKELEKLMRTESVKPPYCRNGLYFFEHRHANQDLNVIYVREGMHGVDQPLIDPHSLTPDYSKSVSIWGISADGGLLAYGVREGGEDEVTVRIMDVASRRDIKDTLPRGRYSYLCFTSDNSGFYYSRYADDVDRIHYHRMGTDPESDPIVFGEGYGPGIGFDVEISDDGNYLLFIVYHGSAAKKSEIYYRDLRTDGKTETVVNDIDARFVGAVADHYLFMQTDWKAPNGRILRVDLNDPARDRWQEIIPEREAALKDFKLAGGRLLVRYVDSVIPTIEIFEPDGRPLTAIVPEAIGWLGKPQGRWQDQDAFVKFSSYHIPESIYLYDLASLTLKQWDKVEVPISSEEFEIRQVWCESADGTEIPMFIAHRRGIKLDGANPTLLYGYGGFRSSLAPYWSSRTALWLKMGGIYAVANLRGGGEFGENWHRAGMLDKKQNTFDDFIAAAEWLIANKYTTPDKLAIRGTSNGGLLVGAALTQRPDLFRAVICGYPLLDMIRYHNFLIAKYWIPEYGSSQDPEQFKFIYAYSPYHNVRERPRYPAVMFVTGDSDTRVDPLHARKMTALLQARAGTEQPILLHYDTSAGHSAGRPVSRRIEDLTDEMLFLIWQLGINL